MLETITRGKRAVKAAALRARIATDPDKKDAPDRPALNKPLPPSNATIPRAARATGTAPGSASGLRLPAMESPIQATKPATRTTATGEETLPTRRARSERSPVVLSDRKEAP